MSNRSDAKKNGWLTYTSSLKRRCLADGTFIRYTATDECTECVAYRNAVAAGRIDGVRGMGNNRNPEKWSDEESKMHSEAIKKGIRRKKGDMNKKQAIAEGLKRYEADNPCARCGSNIRLVSKGGCPTCSNMKNKLRVRAAAALAKDPSYQKPINIPLDKPNRSGESRFNFAPDDLGGMAKW